MSDGKVYCNSEQCIPSFDCSCGIENKISHGVIIKNRNVICQNCGEKQLENICETHKRVYYE